MLLLWCQNRHLETIKELDDLNYSCSWLLGYLSEAFEV